MPILVKTGPVAPFIGAAQNAGNFATGEALTNIDQRQQGINLQAQAQDLAQQRFADQQQQGDENLQFRYDALNATNNRYDAGLQSKVQLQGLRSDEAQALQNLRQAAATGRLTQRDQDLKDMLESKLTSQEGMSNLSRDAAEGRFWDGTLPQRYSAESDANQRSQNSINAAGQRQKNNFDNRAQNPPGGGPNADARLWSQQQRQWDQQKQILEFNIRQYQAAINQAQRANYGAGDRVAVQNFQKKLDDAWTAYNAHIAQQPQIPQQPSAGDQTYYDNNPANMLPDTSPGAINPGDQGPTGAPGAHGQAGAAPPVTHMQDSNGTVWVFTGQYDPQSGEPLYTDQQ